MYLLLILGGGVRRDELVFPEPRKPVMIVMGIMAGIKLDLEAK